MKTFILILVLTFGVFVKAAEEEDDAQFANRGLSPRIIGGFDAQPGDFPWQVFIKIRKPLFQWSYCGGSLISSNWILTAAHCVEGAIYYKIKVGGIYTADVAEPGSVVTKTLIRRKHRGYYSHNLNNDIALIKLLNPIAETETIKYLRLPRRSVGTFAHTNALVSGWGRTEDTNNPVTLKYTPLNVITNFECEKSYPGIVTTQTICCKGDLTESTCYGDSGGALITFENDGLPSQIGVVSFVSGKTGCSNKDPTGFTRVSNYLDWIHGYTDIPIRP